MKMLSLIVMSCMIFSIYAQCTCSQLTQQQDCQNNVQCSWNASNNSCQNFSCELQSQDSCFVVGNVQCYYNGVSCISVYSCSDITVTQTQGQFTCGIYGCNYTDGDFICSPGNCSYTSSTQCNYEYALTENGLYYCNYSSENRCQYLSDSTPCSQRSEFSNCIFNNTTCAWIDEGEDEQCITGCQEASISDCNSTFVNQGYCQYIDSQCTFVKWDLSCSNYNLESTCKEAYYCTWKNDACISFTCADAECTGTTVSAHASGSPDNYIFCQEQNESCQEVVASDMNYDECNSSTNNYYEWNGFTCQKCKMGLQVVFSLALIAALLAFFA